MRYESDRRLIRALGAQLKAERETREAAAEAIRNGLSDPDTLLAILEDPIRPASTEDLARAEALVTAPRNYPRVQPRAA